MRIESTTIARAFIDGRAVKGRRTYTDGHALWLHHNRIAWWLNEERTMLAVCCQGRPTVTTKDRLNTILYNLGLPRSFYTRNYQLYFHNSLRPVDAREVIAINVPLARELLAA